MSRPKVLIIEDDDDARAQLKWALKDEFDVVTAKDPGVAVSLAREMNPTVTILDLGLPPNPADPEGGLQLLRKIRDHGDTCKVIVCTGYGERQHAIRAVNYGAYDFFTKPVDLDLLKFLTRRACWISELEQERLPPAQEMAGEIEEIIGRSESIRKIFAAIRKIATTDVPVLITGESGTGKELAAKAIHERGLRKNGPFVAIDCAAIPETLLESELFGHERGAFTGATEQKRGRVEYAQRGTLFLDEIGELPLTLQVKLLRFLQEKTIERVGGRQLIEVDARIVAATRVDLQKAIERGAFREDLYYRIGVVNVQMPPLRDRGDDVLLIALAFLKRLSEQMRKRVEGFTNDGLRAIQTYSWPGNVRELSNKVSRAVAMSEGPYITSEDLDLRASEKDLAMSTMSLKEAREQLERDLLVNAMTLHRGNLSRVADQLKISRPTLYGLLRKYGMRAGPDKPVTGTDG